MGHPIVNLIKYYFQAVHLLIASNQIDKALALCLEHNVPITEDMVE